MASAPLMTRMVMSAANKKSMGISDINSGGCFAASAAEGEYD